MPWSQAFSPSHQRPALHHINPQSPLTNTLHGHDLDFALVMSFDLDFTLVLTFDLDFKLVWLWLSSNSPTLFFKNYLSSELSFSVAMSMYSFFSILREWNYLTPLSMQHQISHLCSYSVLNAMNPWSCCQAKSPALIQKHQCLYWCLPRVCALHRLQGDVWTSRMS